MPPTAQPPAPPLSPEPGETEILGSRMLANFQAELGDAWENKLTPAQRQLAVDAMNDAATLAVGSLITGLNTTAEWNQVRAQLANIASIEANRLDQAISAAIVKAAFQGIPWLLARSAPFLL